MPKSRSKRRKTQPPPKTNPKRSAPWVGALFFTLMASGVIVIVVNYLGVWPGGTVNARLWFGLGLISASFLVATQWY